MNFPTSIEGRERAQLPPIAGKIKIGMRVKTKNRKGEEIDIPKAIDYFRFVPADGPDAPRLLAAWNSLYAEPQKGKPREVPVMLPGNDRRRVFPQAWRAFRKGRLWCIGNNRTADRRNQAWDGWEQWDCNAECPYRKLRGPEYEGDRNRICEEGGRLHLLLPEMPVLGVFVVEASSMSMDRLDASLDVIEAAADSAGLGLNHIPLFLQLQSVPNTRFGTVYVFELAVRHSVRELAAARSNPRLLLGAAPLDEEEPVDARETWRDEDTHRAVTSADEDDAADGTTAPAAPPAHGEDDSTPDPPAGAHGDDEAHFIRGQCYGLISQIEPTRRQDMGRRLSEADGDVRDLTELREELRRMAREAGGAEAAPPV